MDIMNYTWEIVMVLYFFAVVSVIATVLSERRNPVKSVAWITVILLLPIAGLGFFILFGQKYRRKKIFNRKILRDLKHIEQYSKKQVKELSKYYDANLADNIKTIKLLLNNSKTLLTYNNDVKVLQNGDNTFADIIDELKKAKESIHLEYYIYEVDELGKQIAEILVEKAMAGVEVRFIYDDVGSWHIKRKFLRKLNDAGVETHCFIPVVFPILSSKINYRNHRKIIVIDGQIGYTGGINIADRYIHGTKNGIWRDTHLKIKGDAVRMMQIIFLTDWIFATRKPLENTTKYLTQKDVEYGYNPIQIAASGPDSNWASIMQAYFTAITDAKHHIYISTPYFMPNEAILTALKVAALSGIDVKIMLPEKSDSKLVHWASRSYFKELLEAKVKIYLYTNGFNHSKLMCVDGNFSTIGSVNMDERSFEVNFEITAMIYDKDTTNLVEKAYLADINTCKHLTLNKWNNRKHQDNFKESVARLFSPLL